MSLQNKPLHNLPTKNSPLPPINCFYRFIATMFMAPKKQIMYSYFPFSIKGAVFNTGSTQEVFERV